MDKPKWPGARQCLASTRTQEIECQAAGGQGGRDRRARVPGGAQRRGWLRRVGDQRSAAPLSRVIFHLDRLIFVPGEDNE